MFGDHAVSCAFNGFSARHHKLQVAFISVLQEGGVPHRLEAQGAGAARPADLLIPHGKDGLRVAVEFTVVQPSPSSAFPLSLPVCTRALARAEEAKVAKHTRSCNTMGWAFSPLGFSTCLAEAQYFHIQLTVSVSIVCTLPKLQAQFLAILLLTESEKVQAPHR